MQGALGEWTVALYYETHVNTNSDYLSSVAIMALPYLAGRSISSNKSQYIDE